VKDSVLIVNQSDVDSEAEKEDDIENDEAASYDLSVHEAFFKLRIEKRDIVVKFFNYHSKDDIYEVKNKKQNKTHLSKIFLC